MTRSPMRDFLVGLFVLVGLGAIAYLSFSVGGLSYSGPGGLKLYALFDQTGGLKARSPVVISGVKVGQVKDISLDTSYRARIEMDLDNRLKLPTDTSASIVTAGGLRPRHRSLQGGGGGANPKAGETTTFSPSAPLPERPVVTVNYGPAGAGTA